MSLILKINKYLALCILSEWLMLVDFVWLDIAMASSTQMTSWMTLVLQHSPMLEKLFLDEWVNLSDKSIRWLERKNMHLVPMTLRNSDILLKPKLSWRSFCCRRKPSSRGSFLNNIKRLKMDSALFIKSVIAMDYLESIDLVELVISGQYYGVLKSDKLLSIKILRIESCLMMHSFYPLIKNCVNLIEFEFDQGVEDSRLPLLLTVWCRQLKVLKVLMLNKRASMILAIHAGPSLQYLTLLYDDNVIRTVRNYKRCELSHRLSVVSENVISTFNNPFDEETIAKLSNVTELKVSNNYELSAVFFANLSLLPRLNGLCFAIFHLVPIKSISVEFQLKSYPNTLKILDLSNCAVDDETLHIFANYCPNVTDLNLALRRSFTEFGLRCIAQRGKLEKLDLRGTNLFSDALDMLSCFCFSLKWLNISYLRCALDEESVYHLIDECRSLRYLSISQHCCHWARISNYAQHHNPRLSVHITM